MKKISLLLLAGALSLALGSGCATGQAASPGARVDACAFPTDRASGPPRQLARGNLGSRREPEAAISAPLARAARGAQVASCLTGMVHAGDQPWTRAF